MKSKLFIPANDRSSRVELMTGAFTNVRDWWGVPQYVEFITQTSSSTYGVVSLAPSRGSDLRIRYSPFIERTWWVCQVFPCGGMDPIENW